MKETKLPDVDGKTWTKEDLAELPFSTPKESACRWRCPRCNYSNWPEKARADICGWCGLAVNVVEKPA